MRHFISSLILLFLTACVIKPQDKTARLEAPWPLKEPAWRTRHYTHAGGDACAVSAGRNSLEVLSWKEGEEKHLQVRSTRDMNPGVQWQIRVAGHIYRSSEPALTAEKSRAAVKDLQNAQIVYLEWSEPDTRMKRAIVANMVNLEGFKAALGKCDK